MLIVPRGLVAAKLSSRSDARPNPRTLAQLSAAHVDDQLAASPEAEVWMLELAASRRGIRCREGERRLDRGQGVADICFWGSESRMFRLRLVVQAEADFVIYIAANAAILKA
jgi:hypothetical protein